MDQTIDHTTLHRTAKIFMDSGRAETLDEAMALLTKFGLTISVGDEIACSVHHQTALLTLVNVARRTLLGGIAVHGLPDCESLTPLAPSPKLIDAVRKLGGIITPDVRADWPVALIGGADRRQHATPCWRVTWQGWKGGVVPAAHQIRLDEADAIPLAPALAAGVCAAEVFSYYAADHAMAGRRAAGLSLWQLGHDWLAPDETENAVPYLPSRLWLIGLGNLGQAFAWLLATLPYADRSKVQLVLQDFDRIAPSNDSTSLLSFLRDVGRRKARVVAAWLDTIGFDTFVEERRYSASTRRQEDEPGVALCGVDNANARANLEAAGFVLVVEAGLGAGPEAFRSIALHTFPASRRADEIWPPLDTAQAENYENMPAYKRLKEHGMDACGLAQLASRTVGVPFVGLIAGCLVIAELLRRLNGGVALEFASGSTLSLDDFEYGALQAPVYEHGHVRANVGIRVP